MTIDILMDMLHQDKPSVVLRNNEEMLFEYIKELRLCKGFKQNSVWHQYDVLEHIYHVIDNTPNNEMIRLAALFHDVGKPFVYTEDEDKNGHFFNHWNVSRDIFVRFVERNNIDSDISTVVSNLILYHDKNLANLTDEEEKVILNTFDNQQLEMLFELKKADLLAQNEKFHYLIDDYEKQKQKMVR